MTFDKLNFQGANLWLEIHKSTKTIGHYGQFEQREEKDKPRHLLVHLQEVEDQICPDGNAQCQSKQPLHLSEQAKLLESIVKACALLTKIVLQKTINLEALRVNLLDSVRNKTFPLKPWNFKNKKPKFLYENVAT